MVENVNEVWKDVVVDKEEPNKYKGLYMVSNFGRVRRLHNGKEKILKVCIDEGGYECVSLSKDGVQKQYKINRLTALVFVANPENKTYVDHIDGDRRNNKAENLRWVTQKENMNNTITKERLSGANSTSATKVICITTGREFDTLMQASEVYGVAISNITKCCRGKLKSAGKLSDGTKLVWKYSEEKSSEFDMVENLPNEIWKDVIVDIEEPNKYKGLYMVSNLGRVKSLYNGKEKILKGSIDKKGYECVSLSKDGVVKVYKINRLVALAFISNSEIKPYVNHIDVNRRNNRA